MMDEVKRGGMAARSAWEISLDWLVTGLVITYVWIVAVCLSKVDTINSKTNTKFTPDPLPKFRGLVGNLARQGRANQRCRRKKKPMMAKNRPNCSTTKERRNMKKGAAKIIHRGEATRGKQDESERDRERRSPS